MREEHGEGLSVCELEILAKCMETVLEDLASHLVAGKTAYGRL